MSSNIFTVSTLAVGGLYSLKIIKGRSTGGRARIAIYLTLVFILCSSAMPQTLQWIIYVVGAIAIIAVACLIIMLISKISSSKKSVIETQQHSTNAKTSIEMKTQVSQTLVHKKLVSQTNQIKSNNESKTVTSNDILEFQEDKKTNSLYELWEKRNVTKKCLTATMMKTLI